MFSQVVNTYITVAQFTNELAVDSCFRAATNVREMSLFRSRTMSAGIRVGLTQHDAFPCNVIVMMVVWTSNEEELAVEATIQRRGGC